MRLFAVGLCGGFSYKGLRLFMDYVQHKEALTFYVVLSQLLILVIAEPYMMSVWMGLKGEDNCCASNV